MPSSTRMKRIFLEGLLWLYLFQFGHMALSLEPEYLDFDNLPDTNFTCVGKVIGGYYADLETNCQMFHVCTIGQADEPMDIRFLCLNGTVFDQETRVCERIDEVDCSKSEQFYSLNLELYGNSGAILEESPEPAPETEPPSIIIKSTTPTSTTTTTTTTKRPTVRPTNSPYHTTSGPSAATTSNRPQIISNHHFPVNSPDIRFNPEEINISLNAGAPPDIRTKHFLPHGFSDSSQEIVNDNVDSDEGQSDKVQNPERPHVSSSTSPKTIYSVNNNKNNEKFPDIGEVDFAYSDEEYQTEPPQQRHQQFFIQTNSFRHSQSFPPNVNYNGNHGQYHHEHFHSTTAKQTSNPHQEPAHSTVRTIYLHSLKPPEVHQHHHYTHHHTEKPPQRVQIPIPLLPTLSPLTFSSPAPFSLQRHIETKRYTKDHQAPPRIIISASASVSDASGRRLNYSLGTIGAAQILKTPPSSYDEYKDSDVGLDPFYHDVPKVNQKKRKRRSTESKEEKINPFDIIKNEKEAVEVLKFLFTWYQSHQATATALPVTSPVTPDLIHTINHELAAKSSENGLVTDSTEISKEETSSEYSTPSFENNQLFKKNGRYSIIGGYRNLGTELKFNPENTDNDSIHAVNTSFNETEVVNYSKLDNSDKTTRNEKPELKEKMDDYEMTIIGDNKESYFNPYDYVDDNYEGTAYKEENSNTIKETIIDKKNISYESVHGHTKTESYSIDPKTKSELYRYFQVDSISELPKLTKEYEEIPNFSPHNDEFTSINNIVDDTSTITESLNDNVTSNIPDTDKVKETDKPTQENISSDDHESNISPSTSPVQPSRYTTTTPEPTSSRTNTIRRGRGRQRYRNDRYSGRSRTEERNSNTIKSIEKNYNEISSSQPSNRRTRKRGRSRFNDSYSSTSTTIATTTAESNITEDSPASTTMVGLDSTHSPEEILTKIINDLNEQTTIDAMVTELYTTYDASKPNQGTHENLEEKEVHTDRIETLGHFTINIPDLLINSENGQKNYENVDHTESQIDPSYSDDGIKIDALKIEKDSLNNSVSETYLKNQTAYYHDINIPIESIETIEENDRTTDIELENVPITAPINVHFKELSSFETESEPKSDDSSYLVKLLRYFAEIALNLDSEKNNPKTGDINTTENKAIVTEKVTSPINNKENKNEIRQGNEKNYGTHNSIEASTKLPTLRQLFETTRKSKGDIAENNGDISIYDQELFSTLRTEILQPTKSYEDTYTEEPIGATTDSPDQKLKENIHIETKAQLLEQLHLIEQSFVGKDTAISVTDATPTDTTITTPFVSFEHPESFATTESSSTMPSISADIHVPETHALSTESTQVLSELEPGLDRKSTDQTNLEKVSDEFSTASIRDSTKSTDIFHDDTATTSVYVDEYSEIAETITMDSTTQTYAPENLLIPKQDVSLTSNKPEDITGNVHSSIQSDVEIQKSISLPVSILQTTFDVSQDVNNAQEINNLVPNKHSTDIPISTRTKEVHQGFIHEIEATTNSAVENDVPINSSFTETYDTSITETVPTSKVTSEDPSINYKQEYISSSRYPIIPEVLHNTTEILFVKDTESPKSANSDLTTNFPSSTPVKSPGMLNSSHLLQVTVETTTTVPETTILTSTSKPYHTRKVRPPKRRPYTNPRKQFGRHRFSTELFTSKPQKHVEVELPSRINLDNITDAPLHRSATPTRSELRKVTLHTTPLSSKTTRYPSKVNRHYVFNCFGKDINKFYADPRDCRLFHYCTQGYSKNQLLDLKFVCDRRTFFDDEKLICTKVKPARCL